MRPANKKCHRLTAQIFSLIFKANRGLLRVFYYRIVSKNSLQGPQKMFGGLHAARGPQFGYVWSKTSILSKHEKFYS